MAENFDELYKGDRAFVLGGQTFHWRPLHWREWGKLNDQRIHDALADDEHYRKRMEELKKAGKTEVEAATEIDLEETVVENFEKHIERIKPYLVEDELSVFETVVNDPKKAVSIAQLRALLTWLEGVQHPDRPTTAPSASSSGPGSTGATSPAA